MLTIFGGPFDYYDNGWFMAFDGAFVDKNTLCEFQIFPLGDITSHQARPNQLIAIAI